MNMFLRHAVIHRFSERDALYSLEHRICGN